MPRSEKEMMTGELKSWLEGNGTFLIAGYSGLGSNEMNELRQVLGEVGGGLRVVKNRLARLAMQEQLWSQVGELIEGPTAFVFTQSDPVAVLKALAEFARGHKQLQLRGGLVESVLVGEQQIMDLASLPSREWLLGRFLSGLVSPVTGFLNVLNGPIGAFARCLGAIKDKLGASESQDSGAD